MIKWLRRVVVLVLVVSAVRWFLTVRGHGHQAGTGSAPVIGGDTWPPVPVKPERVA
jgi:hypothetical protein